MNTKLKTLIIIASTLVVGFLLGIAGDQFYMRQRIKRYREIPRPHMMFYKMSESILQPTEEQKEQIAPIFDKYSQRMLQEHISGRQRASALLDSLQAELKPYLTVEQFQRLQESRSMAPEMWGRPPRRPPDGAEFQKSFRDSTRFRNYLKEGRRPFGNPDSLRSSSFRDSENLKKSPSKKRGF